MKNNQKHVLILVSHTHWDPEWYSTYQEYRIRLIKLVDKLLNILENDSGYRHFMFDGQVSAIEDYLDVRPENEERIRRLVRQGKLLIGPWWILPEEFMISPESHIRNLLLGHEAGKRLGGVMKVSYLCDMPGHISQMPQILNGFDIRANAAYRGIKGYPNTNQSLFRWKAPDGSEVLMIHMVKDYGNASELALSGDFIGRLRSIAGDEASWTSSKYLLLMNGGDHLEPSADIPAIIREFNRRERNMTLVHGTLPQYVALVRKENHALKLHTGELRATAKSQIFSSGNLATRMNIKTSMRAAEILLEQWAEPFGTLVRTLGGPDQSALIRRSWRYLLQNNFHDVIYGGHVDGVTADVLNRCKASREISHLITQESLFEIARQIDTRGSAASLVVFNPLARETGGTGRFEFFDNDFNAPEKKGKQLAFRDETGALVPCQVNGREQTTRFTTDKGVIENKDAIPSMRYEVSFQAANIPGLGYRTCTAVYLSPKEIRQQLPKTDLVAHPRFCENRHLKVRINRNGTIDLTDKLTGNVYRRLNYFEDSGDCGDHYFFAPPRKNRIVTSLPARAQISLHRKGPAEAEYKIVTPFKVPVDSARDARGRKTVVCRITTFVSLKTESKRIDINTVIDNRAKNHRIRAVFPSGISAKSAYADCAFDVIKRPNLPVPRPHWKEKPEGYYPQRLFMSLNNGTRGFTLINGGLPQYQVSRTGNVYLTLLRCVSHLAKRWIPGWGIQYKHPEQWPTPGAQEIETHCFNYAVYPHADNWRHAGSHEQALAFNASLKAVQTGNHPGKLPRRMGFVELSPSELVLSSFKPAQNGKGAILRLYNVSGQTINGAIKLTGNFQQAREVKLNEEKSDKCSLIRREKSNLFLRVAPHKIITLHLD